MKIRLFIAKIWSKMAESGWAILGGGAFIGGGRLLGVLRYLTDSIYSNILFWLFVFRFLGLPQRVKRPIQSSKDGVLVPQDDTDNFGLTPLPEMDSFSEESSEHVSLYTQIVC